MESTQRHALSEDEIPSVIDLTTEGRVEQIGAKERTKQSVQDRRGKKRRRRSNEPVQEEETEEEETKRLLSNTQERRRMEKLNTALEDLRRVLPAHFHLYNRRMSKIRTLRVAMNYIATLSEIISKDNAERQEAYRRTIIAAQSTPIEPMYCSPPGSCLPLMQTPGPPASPYFPFYSTLYDLSCGNMYQTPVQTPPKPQLQPRHLDFFTPKQQQAFMTRSACERKKPGTVQPHPRDMYDTPVVKRERRRKVETISSPLVGTRNSDELGSSFLSTPSEPCREEGDQKTLSPLEDLIEDDYHNPPRRPLALDTHTDTHGLDLRGYQRSVQRRIP